MTAPAPRLAMRVAALAVLLSACASAPSRQSRDLRIAGSDTMRPLAERWAQAFMARNPDAVLHVDGGGTGTGIAALVEGRVELATGSRPFQPEEVRQIADRHGTIGLSTRCARDALSVYVHPANPVRDIGRLSLKGIFSGRIGSWHKLGGAEAPIHVLIRPPNSGTHRLFRALTLQDEPYSERATVLPTTEAIVEAVRRDPLAIGFGGIAYGSDLVHCAIDGIAPTPENVRSGAYPLGRYLYLHSIRPPRGLAARFAVFALGVEGQRVVEQVGFVPLFEPVQGR